MSKKRVVIFSLVLAIAAILAAFGMWLLKNRQEVGEVVEEVSNETAVEQAKLKIFSDKVEVLVPGENDWKEGLDGLEIVAGTRVRTNETGRAEVQLPGGSVTRIDYSSEILFEVLDAEESNFVINLSRGKIWSRVSRILGKVSYESKSGRTVATVRGTEYGHEIHDTFDRVVVAESKVQVKCNGENPNMMVGDVEVTDWECGKDVKPMMKESSIQELVEDEWYRFNLQNNSETENRVDPIKVLGVQEDESAYIPTPRPTTSNMIECVGPDGKTARSTKEDCDRLRDYWSKNPPPPAAYVDLGGSSSVSAPNPTSNPTPIVTPTPLPSATPLPFTLLSASCDSYYGCFTMDVVGSGFANGIRIKVKDANGLMNEGSVQVNDANNVFVDFGNYSLCFSGVSPYDVMAFYVDGSFQTVSGFVPGFCSIVN